MNNENFLCQLSKVKVMVNSNLNSIGLSEIFECNIFSSGLKNHTIEIKNGNPSFEPEV